MYGLLFHDIHGIIAASTAALKSYQETPSALSTSPMPVISAGPKHPHVDLKGALADVEADEEPMEKDSGVLPPDLVPVDE